MKKDLVDPRFHFDGEPCIKCGLTKRYIKEKKCVNCIDSRRVRYDTPEYKRASEQSGQCAICSVPLDYLKGRKLFHIDHDHKTEKVRGILCSGCNNGLRHFKDDTRLLNKAIVYLGGNYATV